MSDHENEPGQQAVSSHRLPTVSASDALEGVGAGRPGMIATGLKEIDALFRDSVEGEGGIPRGQTIEVYGPPGAGKTAFCLQAVAAALEQDGEVTWIDTATPVPGPRLKNVVEHHTSTKDEETLPREPQLSVQSKLSRITHYFAPTIAHLLTIIMRLSDGLAKVGTSLVVVDCISSIIDTTFPRRLDDRSNAKNDHTRWLSSRRQAIIEDVGSKLSKLAALQGMAVLVTSNTITKVRGVREAVLLPSLSGPGWEDALGFRLLLYRDWMPLDAGGVRRKEQTARFARLVKASPSGSERHERSTVTFSIDQDGIKEQPAVAKAGDLSPAIHAKSSRSRKRAHEEVEDSQSDESDEYGWDENAGFDAEDIIDASFI